DAAQVCRVAGGDGVEPAATPRSAGHRAVLAPGAANTFADAVVQFCGERPTAHSCRVGLDDTDDPIQVPGRYARATPQARDRAVRAGYIRIRPVIDIEQAALSRLEQKPLAALESLVQKLSGVLDVRPEPLGVAQVFITECVGIELPRFR